MPPAIHVVIAGGVASHTLRGQQCHHIGPSDEIGRQSSSSHLKPPRAAFPATAVSGFGTFSQVDLK